MVANDGKSGISNGKGGGASGVAYLLALPPILLLFIYKIIPFISGFILPFKDYDVVKGLARSSWVGLDNFGNLFGSFIFPKIIANTIILKIEYIILCSGFALLLALILGFIQSKFWRRLFSTIFLLPCFIPTAVFSYLVLYAMNSAGVFFLFSTESLIEPNSFRLIYPILETIKNLGIPLIIALGAINAKRESDDGTSGFLRIQLLPAIKAIGLFALVQLSALLTMDYELLSSFQNPSVYEVADTIDTYSFKLGLMNTDFGTASAAWLVRYVIQLALTIMIFFLIKKWFSKDIFPKAIAKDKKIKRLGSIVAVVAGLFIVEIYLLLTTAPLAISVVDAFKVNGIELTGEALNNSIEALPFYDSFISGVFNRSFIEYLLIIGFTVIVNGIFTILLAYPLTVKKLSGSRIYTLFLIIVLNIGTGGIHEYLFFKGRNMLNTVFPYIITGLFSLVNVFVLKAIYNARYTSLEERTVNGIEGDGSSFIKRYLPRVIKPVLGLSALQYAFMWNAYYPGQLVYLTHSNQFSPVMLFRNLVMEAQPEIFGSMTLGVMKLAAIVSIPGIIILLLVMVFGSSEIFTGQLRKS